MDLSNPATSIVVLLALVVFGWLLRCLGDFYALLVEASERRRPNMTAEALMAIAQVVPKLLAPSRPPPTCPQDLALGIPGADHPLPGLTLTDSERVGKMLAAQDLLKEAGVELRFGEPPASIPFNDQAHDIEAQQAA